MSSSANSQHSERTPLLAEQQQAQAPPKKSSASWKIYIVISGIFAFLAIFSYCVRSSLPEALTDEQAAAINGFAGQHAFDEYLSGQIEPRPGSSKANRNYRQWLLRTVRDLSNNHTASVEIDEDGVPFVDKDGILAVDKERSTNYWMVESNSVLVKVIGTRGEEDAYLLSAHYDSVPASHGVTDDGIGIAVMLEIYRNILQNPVEHTVIFNFNNYEEMGLWGSRGFLHHPWAKNVRGFLNLEGAGAGGRALMFRASSPDIMAQTMGSRILQHANVLGNDLFELGLIKSATDYTVYLEGGIPGIDLAFYAKRSHYHTTRDTLEYTNPRSLQHMGDLALAATRGAANSAGIITHEQPEAKPFVYYDILGQFGLTYSLLTSQILNSLVLLALPTYLAYSAFQSHQSSPNTNKACGSTIKRSIIGFIMVTITFVVVLVFSLLVGFLLTKTNSVVLYGHIGLGAATIVAAASFALVATQWFFAALDNKFNMYRSALDLETTTAYGLLSLTWIMLVGATFAAIKGIGSLYFVFWMYLGSVIAVSLQQKSSTGKVHSWAAALFAQVCIFYPLIFDLVFMAFDSMRHTLADGTPEIAVYGLLSVFTTLLMICLVPWVHKAGYLMRATTFSGLLLVFLIVITSSLFPFNSTDSPNKLIFKQEVNYTTGASTLSLASYSHVHEAVRAITTDEEWATRNTTIVRKTQTEVTVATKRLPLYFADQKSTQKEMQFSFKRVATSKANVQRVHATIQTQNTAICSIIVNDHPITYAKLDKMELTVPAQQLTILRQKIGEKYSVEFEYEADQPTTGVLSCYYDEWIDGRNPAFVHTKNSIPDWSLLALRGFGVATVNANVQL
ncbi:hypothetical protein K450DRAFT_225601 [Umbelopsis ramanniana AG]|uniref:Peptide hydrolase n=1 Tax=Umbelopsis ramanniana AG TaxID=1314678 RepID=A0AAD5HI54_UMBRA|nr:uncharacterized protein K450DRAFT_225601 [Umbelopsis ramanniana AG]KAI8582948.1 hypothetical protein K450DRAFT_225601 [Umbelopsis ramanniana AG]